MRACASIDRFLKTTYPSSKLAGRVDGDSSKSGDVQLEADARMSAKAGYSGDKTGMVEALANMARRCDYWHLGPKTHY
jgi:hypothetical protein